MLRLLVFSFNQSMFLTYLVDNIASNTTIEQISDLASLVIGKTNYYNLVGLCINDLSSLHVYAYNASF